ncbi:nucleoside phosphorylase [Streptococcus sanguinis]|uniref:nucleoside phosphorylase n=1 Tax=Streptococcus sanguinis TaxID=1305 RepID=UPI0022842C90|nr:nucleoside phosphorylase [Streptococcus sanguinis]MCY7021823.1 nucleoside phosphorylase [Streptococcus sanguinis]
MLLEEFEDVAAVIEPTEKPVHDKGEVCETIILSFNGEILKRLIESEAVYPGGYLKSINGQHPWYIYRQGPSKLAVMLAPIGAPMIVGQLEELAARGFKNFIILGSCGVLDRSIEADKIILPAAALRDEGTSYHYAPPGDEVAYEEPLLVELEAIFDKHDIEHIRAKSWTTDAFYRETPDKVKRRLAAGAKVVDMEASAIMAWSQFRKSKVYQFFYTADYVDHHNRTWDARHEERTADAMTFFTIALTIAKELER